MSEGRHSFVLRRDPGCEGISQRNQTLLQLPSQEVQLDARGRVRRESALAAAATNGHSAPVGANAGSRWRPGSSWLIRLDTSNQEAVSGDHRPRHGRRAEIALGGPVGRPVGLIAGRQRHRVLGHPSNTARSVCLTIVDQTGPSAAPQVTPGRVGINRYQPQPPCSVPRRKTQPPETRAHA